jgi:hypothetical protein
LDSLTTVAEIGIALAGFSGLVVVLRKNTGPLNDIEKYRMSVLLATAFGAMFLALLPGALQDLGLNGSRLWRMSSGILAAFSLVFFLAWVLSSRRFFHVAREIFSVPAFSLVVFGHLGNLVLQLLVTLGYWAGREKGVYLLGLLWLLAHASLQFVRMLFVQPRPAGKGTGI